MSVRRAPAIAGRIIRQLRHDPRTLSLIGIVPLVVISLIGYLISGSKQPLPVAIVNADQGSTRPVSGW